MCVKALVASKVVSILLAVCLAISGALFNNGPALLADMDLYGGEDVVKCVEIGGPSEGICSRMTTLMAAATRC